MNELLTVQEAAAYLRVSEATVLRWCRTRRIPACRIGREWRIVFEPLRRLIARDWQPDDQARAGPADGAKKRKETV